MRAYTVAPGGAFVPSISVDQEGRVTLGQSGRGRKLVLVPVPAGATIIEQRLTDVPGEAGCVVVLVRDQSGFRGGWHLRDPLSDAEWDAVAARTGEEPVEREHTARVIAEGWCAQGDAGGMGGGPEYLLVLGDGQAVEAVRRGRLYGSPSVFRVENRGGEVVVTYPKAVAESRAAAARW